MSHDFLGTGWNFPIVPRDLEGGAPLSIELVHHEESIRQSIWLILSTARGERVMRPDFGCGIHTLVFALDNPSTVGLVQHEVEQALLFWEPRIEVLGVKVSSGPRKREDPRAQAEEYERYCETEARLLFQSLAYRDKEALRAEAREAILGAAGMGQVIAEAGLQEIEAAVTRKIAAEQLPSFSQWRRTRAASPVLLITIDYSVKRTNSRFNVVYPFYLERSQP